MKDETMRHRPRLLCRDGTYYFRAKIPTDLLPFYEPQREIKFSLKTKDKQKAWQLAQIESLRLDAEFARRRNPGSEQYGDLQLVTQIDDTFIQSVCTTYLKDVLDTDVLFRTGEMSEIEYEIRQEELERNSALFRKALATGKTELIDALLHTFLRLSGYELRVPPTEYKRLAFAFLQSYVKSIKQLQLRDEGEIVETEQLAPVNKLLPKPQVSSEPVQGPSYDTVYDCWRNATERRPKTADEYRRILDELANYLKQKIPSQIHRKDIISFRDALLARGQSGKTVDKKIGVLKTIFRLAVENELLEADPTDRVRVVLPKVEKKVRIPFSSDDLQQFFASPVYSQGSRPKAGGGEASFWLPLIAYYTGARLEEMAQLLITDIKQEPGLGYYFHLTDDDDAKTLKTVASRRRVPIHAELLRCGLLYYVNSVKGRSPFLFPDLVPDKYQRRGANFSKFFTRYLRETVGITDRRKVFHSFRHTFKEACREKGVSEDVHDALTGHVGQGEGRRYGNETYPLPPLFKAMQNFQLAGLNLTSLEWSTSTNTVTGTNP